MNIENIKSCVATGLAGAAFGLGAGILAGGTASTVLSASALIGVSFAASQALELVAASFSTRTMFQATAKAFLVCVANFHIIGSAFATANIALGLFSPFGMSLIGSGLAIWQIVNFLTKIDEAELKLRRTV